MNVTINKGDSMEQTQVEYSGVTDEAVAVLLNLHEKAGFIDTQTVVDTAKNPKSPLHQYFEWDDNSAAAEWRLAQARLLIGHVKVTVLDRPDVTTRAFVSLGTGTNREYRSVIAVLNNPDELAELKDALRKEILTWTQRLEAFEEFTEEVATLRGVAESLKETANV